MLSLRKVLGALAGLALLAAPHRSLAQGVTTGAVAGTVTDEAGQPLEGAQVQLRNPRTGLNLGAITRANGLYTIQGVEPDAGYALVVRRIGYAPVSRTVAISLGQTRREDFRLSREAAVLSTVTVTATADAVINTTKTGTSTTLSDSMLRRLPTINRNFADFVQLVPQVSTTTGYLSGGGVNLRQNAIQIDGAQSGDVFGLGTTGQPGAQANAKSIPLDAVKEYQVLLSPYDVRQGGFGGLLINAVTKSGTNEFHGSVYGDTRNQNLTRTQPYLADYSQQHYGATFGGPILKDRLFFFGAGEVQRLQTPATGSFIGAPDQYVAQSMIDSLGKLMNAYNFNGIGGGEQVQKQNPNRNYFLRFDAYLPMATRLVLRHNYAGADNTNFSRGSASSNAAQFGLTSNRYEFSSKTNSTVGEFITNLQNGIYNELLLNYSTTKDFRTVPVNYPQVTVLGVPRTDLATVRTSFVFGTEASSQGNSLDQRTTEITDNFTIPVGAHSLTFGTKNVFYKSINLFAQNSMGAWTFQSLDSLARGLASNYQVSAPAPTDPYNGLATIRANTYALYAQDTWTATPNLSVNFGVRWDKPSFQNLPPENDIVFQQFKRHTSSVPTQAQWSPRIGFNWDVTGDQRNQLRGGIGSFSGAVPFVYLSNAFGNSGLSGFSSITCNNTTNTTTLAPPIFSAAAAANPPLACDAKAAGVRTVGGGAAITGPASGAAVNTIDPDFKYPKYLKGTLGFDHRFANGLIGTIEGLYTRSQNNAFYQNLALAGPLKNTAGGDSTDRNGRVLYGTLSATGSNPLLVVPGGRQQVLDLTNSSGDYTWSLTGQVQKTFSNNFEGSLAYTYQQARDVTSTTSSTAGSNYRYQRSVSGRLDDMSVTRSKYDQPHRIVAIGTYRFPTLTDVSFIYTGNSGAPFDYVYRTNGGSTGDLNADGQTQNDLVYVPTDARDPNQILFTGYNGTPAQQATAAGMATAFENLISSIPCLNNARGTILTRNACRNPWVNEVDVSIAQSLSGALRGTLQNFQVRLDIINFGNLLNRNWGRQAFSDQGNTCGQICSATTLLTHTGSVLTGPAGAQNAQGIFTFDPNFTPYNSDNASSNYRMQLSLKYSF